MSSLTRNITANLAGRVSTAVLGLVLVPVIVRLVGIEAYGLVAFLVTIQALFSILDLGLSSTVNRELARLATLRRASEMRDVVRTLESCYWLTALVIAATMFGLRGPITAWVGPASLADAELRQAVLIMGAVMALQWPLSFYEGGLMGLQRQVVWNVISVSMAVLRQGGAVLVLWLVSPTLQAFLLWQAFTSGVQTALTGAVLWRSLPPSDQRPRFRRATVARVWRFAAGLTGTSIVTLGLTQIDKVVLSRFLSLEAFGYYALAAVAASSLHYLVGPVFTATFPRFSALAARGDQGEILRERYHAVAQFTSVLVLSAALVLIVFAPRIMELWTGDPQTAERTALLVRILAAGTALNGLIHIPYALQLAHGWPSLTLYVNSIAVIVMIPAATLLARWGGAPAVAALWAALNIGYVTVLVPLMHRRLLRGELWRWYCLDIGLPLAGGLVSVLVWWWLIPADVPALLLGLLLVSASASTLGVAGLAAPALRTVLFSTGARWLPVPAGWARRTP